MTREEIEKLPFNIDMLLSESLLVDTKEQVHKKITEVCSLAIKALEQERSRSVEITQYRYDCEKLMEENERLKKALEHEPCEDCISRQATVKRLCKVAEFMNEKRNGLGSPYVMAALFIQDNKDEFPSVTPKPKTDVLDKIRAEIELNRNEWIKGKDAEWHTYDRCLFIIDKYKAESEESNG